ncbi:hypothetical protein Goshw_000729, partial [Gossypium schwendimanii]|nr:hypothetical protein [Gossypium schwendimanii]
MLYQNLMEICFLNLGEIEVNLELHQNEKALHLVKDQALVTLGIVIHLLELKVFIHRKNLHIFNLHMVIHNYVVIIHHFLIMVCHISFKCILHHQCITHLHLSCILLLKYIIHVNYMKTKVKMLLFFYIFSDKGQENQAKNALKVKVNDLILLVILLI